MAIQRWCLLQPTWDCDRVGGDTASDGGGRATCCLEERGEAQERLFFSFKQSPTTTMSPTSPTRLAVSLKRQRRDSTSSDLDAANRKHAVAGDKWIVGVACMDVKARSKPMRNILSRLMSNHNYHVVVFGDKVILDETIENWPTCHFLISFFSTGFPLDKAIQYVKLRQPYCVNNLLMLKVLMNRRWVRI
ncbi:hypothetical protein BC830DRAFT_790453 [Chytriomyces sp. MP71]|nr:hypothetical protein BC830DRAFT_790453 [Chytriomyces sp. MP71]